MASRIDLQTKLESILGSRNVYFQPPESVKMNYPAIVYSRDSIDTLYANDTRYKTTRRYQLILIGKSPDNGTVDDLLSELPMCSYDRFYTADNLNHDVFTLYW